MLITGMSNRITVVIDDELLEQVDEYGDDDNRSETVRELLRKGLDYDDDLADKENQIDRLNRKVAAIQSRREEHQELVEYVENQKQLQRDKQTASAVERAKWFLFGRDLDDD